jgi:hypothetical protein
MVVTPEGSQGIPADAIAMADRHKMFIVSATTAEAPTRAIEAA